MNWVRVDRAPQGRVKVPLPRPLYDASAGAPHVRSTGGGGRRVVGGAEPIRWAFGGTAATPPPAEGSRCSPVWEAAISHTIQPIQAIQAAEACADGDDDDDGHGNGAQLLCVGGTAHGITPRQKTATVAMRLPREQLPPPPPPPQRPHSARDLRGHGCAPTRGLGRPIRVRGEIMGSFMIRLD